jgi:cell division GTPase FtsZ
MSEREMAGVETTPTVSSATSEKLLKIAVIGTGNCGSMLATAAAENLGIDAIAINGSQIDLDLIDCPGVVKIVVGDGKGTGKDRNKAKEFFLSDSGLLLDSKVSKVIESNDVIIIATSTGGGYGSGSSTELLEALQTMYDTKVFIVAGVLPFIDEGSAAFEGTKAWLRELGSLHPSYMIYDNNRYAKNTSPNKAAQRVNEAFVKDLSVMQGDFVASTRTGGMDQRDMLTVLSQEGRIFVDSMEDLELSDIIDNSLIATIKQHIDRDSAHAELVADKEVTASALMYALGDAFDGVKGSAKNDLQETFGEHIKDMSNFSDEDNGTIAVILSGLTEPSMVIDRIINRAKKLEDKISSRKAVTSKLSRIEDTPSKLKTVTAKQSFADETPITNAADEGGASKEELLKRFMEKKNAAK